MPECVLGGQDKGVGDSVGVIYVGLLCDLQACGCQWVVSTCSTWGRSQTQEGLLELGALDLSYREQKWLILSEGVEKPW